MRILVAPDSFKGSLSATEACAALEEGARAVFPASEYVWVPLADGGEGTLSTLLQIGGGDEIEMTACGPLDAPVRARWGKLLDGRAVIETAQASGLGLVAPELREPLRASTYGTGQLIAAALDTGCRRLLVGLGGSATTDGGCGALEALGYRFLNEDGASLPRGGGWLGELAAIDGSQRHPALAEAEIIVLSDVTSPLLGPHGAAHLFGSQKGCTPAEIELLEEGLERLARVALVATGHDCSVEPGAGAAGGLGFGLMAFCGARVKSGIEVVLDLADFAAQLETADLVLTGEGSIDKQTLHGKVIAGVTALARTARSGQGVPVVAFGGAVRLSGKEMDRLGLLSAVPLAEGPLTLEECLADAGPLLCRAVERSLRLLRLPGGVAGRHW